MVEEMSVKVTCPHCETSRFAPVNVLVGSGGVPINIVACHGCEKTLCVEASMDIEVRVVL